MYEAAAIVHSASEITHDHFRLKGKLLSRGLWAALASLATVLLAGMACSQPDSAVAWGYAGAGAPEHWASLSDEYATCANSRQQSPIDIAGYDNSDSTPISFDYSGVIQSINDDGRFVRVGFGPANTLSVGQRTYDLKSAHFHFPSEHLIGDESFSAELHLIHNDGVRALDGAPNKLQPNVRRFHTVPVARYDMPVHFA